MKQSDLTKEMQLGMPYGTARNKLNKSILFNFAGQLNLLKCFQCNSQIEDVDNFSVEHKIPWLHGEKPLELFFDLSNIAFSHHSCNSKARRTVKVRMPYNTSGYKGVHLTGEESKNKAKYQLVFNSKKIAKSDDPVELALMYDVLATEKYGDNAVTNCSLGLL